MVLKIVSLNLWWGGNLFPEILEFLRAEDADVIALQEVYNGHGSELAKRYRSVEVLQKQLPYKHSAFAQSFIHDGPAGKIPQGNAVFSKFPITTKSSRYLIEPTRKYYQDVPELWPIFPRVLQRVAFETSAGEVNIFNMHGVWDMDGDNYSDSRKQMRDIIIAETQGKTNVILTGDTNARQTNQAMRDLEKHLKPVFGPELKSTFNMRRKDNPGYATSAVDLMYVSPQIKVISKTVPDIDISDHLPLVVSLDIA